MAVKSIAEAASKTDRLLAKHGLTRRDLLDFWKQCTDQGRVFEEHGLPAEEADLLQNDTDFVLHVVLESQAFLFGDKGDVAVGAPTQPASEDELDGIFGPMSISRMRTYLDSLKPAVAQPQPSSFQDYLLWDGKPVPVHGVRVLVPGEPGAIDLYAMSKRKPARWNKPKWAVLETSHWDVCLNSHSAARTLAARGLSSSYGIDNPSQDGFATVYLWLDPGRYRGAHAGHPGNSVSAVSSDYTNAIYIDKYAGWYEKNVGWPRPVIEAEVHGRRKKFLGMYAAQVVAGMRVKQAYSKIAGIPFVRHVKPDGMPWATVIKGLGSGAFHGAVTHLHWTTGKWDVAGLPEQEIVLLLAFPQLQAEFPELTACYRLQESRWQDWLTKIRTSWTWAEVFGAKTQPPWL